MFALETVLSECCIVGDNGKKKFFITLTHIIPIMKYRNLSVLLTHIF